MQVVAKEQAQAMGANGVQNADGTITIDLCLNCRVERANRIKHGYA
jgi:hypothetical protein